MRLELRVLMVAVLASAVAVALIAVRPSSTEVAPRLTPIAIDAAVEREPRWSPDGNALLFLRDVGGTLQVFTKNVAAASASQVTRSDTSCINPFWAADGTRIYYTAEPAGLWSVSAIGGQAEIVEPNARAASASPDGKLLAFFRDTTGNYTLWLRSSGGAQALRYTRGPFSQPIWVALRSAFSPDEKN